MKLHKRFTQLPSFFFESVPSTPLLEPRLFFVSKSCQKLLDTDLNEVDLLAWLNGQIRIDGDQSFSTRYAGHQFGNWAGQLGDGRAITIAEIKCEAREENSFDSLELQTKGSGQTPFSRQGDGRAVLRSSVREFVCSEHMQALGVFTSRALALITSNEKVQREELETGAIIARVFPTNLRFGHFEMAFHSQNLGDLKKLFEYVQLHYFSNKISIVDMIEDISTRTAKMLAQWMSFGFCHGVMNTDNMSILGMTLDYGPFGFMEDFQMDWVCNHSDYEGRYSYKNQPLVALWNLDRFLWTCSPFVEKNDLQKIFDHFMQTYQTFHLQIFRKKLGLTSSLPEDPILIEEMFTMMQLNKVDFSYFFRSLLPPRKFDDSLSQDDSLDLSLKSEDTETEDPFWTKQQSNKEWRKKYYVRLKQEKETHIQIAANMKKVNPKYVFKNYIAEEMIELAKSNRVNDFANLFHILVHPFDEHPQYEKYSLPTPIDKKGISVSCSS